MHDSIIELMTRLAAIASAIEERYGDDNYKEAYKATVGAYHKEKRHILHYMSQKPLAPGHNATKDYNAVRTAKAPPRPERLSHEASPYEFHDWKQRFLAYARFHDFVSQRYEDQKEHIKTCLGPELADFITSDPRQLPAHPNEFEQSQKGVEDTWMDALEEFFLNRHPLCNRRVAVSIAEPFPNEPDSHYMRRVVRDCGVAKISRKYMYVEDMILAQFTARVRNPMLRAALSKAEGSLLHEMVRIGEMEDNKFQGNLTYLPTESTPPGTGANAPRQAASSNSQSFASYRPRYNAPPMQAFRPTLPSTFRPSFSQQPYRGAARGSRGGRGYRGGARQSNPAPPNSNTSQAHIRCTFCSKYGHKEMQCETKRKNVLNLAAQVAHLPSPTDTLPPPVVTDNPADDNFISSSASTVRATGTTGGLPHETI